VSEAPPCRKLDNANAQHRCGHAASLGQRKRVAHSDNINSSQVIEIG
jgi:hypothetical protein